MPITRRKRANPPEEPDNNKQNTEAITSAGETALPAASAPVPVQPEADHTPAPGAGAADAGAYPAFAPYPSENGDRQEPRGYALPLEDTSASSGVPRSERVDRVDRQEYLPSIEGGRRTSRGELFRRPPQPPASPQPPVSPQPPAQAQAQIQPPVAPPPPVQIQAPSHEITLPLGNLLHLAYNPGYTGSDEARSVLLNQLANQSKEGGRARCWNCGAISIAYERWNTRSKTFGEIGIAYCEICGVWSVL